MHPLLGLATRPTTTEFTCVFGKDEDRIRLDRAILSAGAGDGDTRALGQLHRSNLNRLPYDRVIVYGRQKGPLGCVHRKDVPLDLLYGPYQTTSTAGGSVSSESPSPWPTTSKLALELLSKLRQVFLAELAGLYPLSKSAQC